jgi:hypothetical protein
LGFVIANTSGKGIWSVSYCVCFSCGRKEFSPNELACDVLAGWLMVLAFNGNGSVIRYNFVLTNAFRSG